MHPSQFALLAGFAFVCCTPSGHTVGQRGVYRFVYATCRLDHDENCTGVDEPIAAGGAQVAIAARPVGGAPPFVAARSSDNAVFGADVVDGYVVVTSANSGQANLQLVDEGSGVVDEIELDVEPVAKVQVSDPFAPNTPVLTKATVLDGVSQTVHFDRLDAFGRTLIGYNGIDFVLPPPIVRDPDPAEPAGTYFEGSPLTFHGSDGTAVVTASAGAGSTSLTLTFVDPSLVTSLTVASLRNHFDIAGHSLTAIDTSGALADGTPVFGALCQWDAFTGNVATYSDASTDSFEPSSLEHGPLWRTYFEGTGTARCTVGNTTMTINVP